MQPNFEQIIPKRVLFSIKDIDTMGIIRKDLLRKMILQKTITVTKIGNKNHISRDVLLEYLKRNTFVAQNSQY